MAQSRDRRLVARMRRGDDAAFEHVYARHQAALLAFCRHLTGSREDAEDAVQHAFLAAYRQLTSSDEEIELRPWLYTVARNRCLSLLRARRERPVAVQDDAASSLEGLSAEVERRQELRDLVRDLARLPEPQRAALVLSQLDALSYREIGVVLDVEPVKVKALVFQARSSLASAREARDTPCLDIRREIATARGAGLRQRLLRRHVGQCDGCREFEVAVRRQRRDLGSLLPVVPSAGLAGGLLGGGQAREGATLATAAGGGSAAAGAGGGLLAAVGVPGLAKLAVVVAVAGGGVAATAAEVPQQVAGAGDLVRQQAEGPTAGVGGGDLPAGAPSSDRPPVEAAGPVSAEPGEGSTAHRERTNAQLTEPTALAGGAPDSAGPSPGGEARDEGGGASDPTPDPSLPPGLARRDELPPGLAKRDELPPGLAKGGDPASKGHGPPVAGPGRGQGTAGPGSGGSAGQDGDRGQTGNGGQGGNGGKGSGAGGAGGQSPAGSGPPSGPPGNANGNAGGNGNADGGQPGNGGQPGGGPGNGKGKAG